jgi:hypothetical protein
MFLFSFLFYFIFLFYILFIYLIFLLYFFFLFPAARQAADAGLRAADGVGAGFAPIACLFPRRQRPPALAAAALLQHVFALWAAHHLDARQCAGGGDCGVSRARVLLVARAGRGYRRKGKKKKEERHSCIYDECIEGRREDV